MNTIQVLTKVTVREAAPLVELTFHFGEYPDPTARYFSTQLRLGSSLEEVVTQLHQGLKIYLLPATAGQ